MSVSRFPASHYSQKNSRNRTNGSWKARTIKKNNISSAETNSNRQSNSLSLTTAERSPIAPEVRPINAPFSS